MALQTVRIGSLENITQYDDSDFDSAIETDQPIKAGTPVDANDVMRLGDVGSVVGDVIGPLLSVDDNIVEFDGITGKLIKDGGLSHNDTSDAISKKHTQDTDTALGALGTKDPPIDADKVIYRDSTASDALVTSTWTQIKSFLKTYFDTLYALLPGAWTTPAYDSGNFTASGTMTWTVASGDVTTYAYTISGKVMTVSFRIDSTTVGGTLGNGLYILIPGGKTATKTMNNAFWYSDNGTKGIGRCQVDAGLTNIRLFKMDTSNWAASTDLTSLEGQITFEIN